MRTMILAFAFAIAGGGVADARTYRISPGAQATAQLKAAAAALKPGDEIRFDAGVFDLAEPIAINADRVSVSGRGADRTVLSFAAAAGDAPALSLKGARLEIGDLAVEEAPRDAIAISGERVTVSGVRVAWADASPRGGSGLVVEGASDVRIERVRAERAKGAGVAVRGSQRAAIRESAFADNRVGVIIETSRSALLEKSTIGGNGTGALLVNAPRAGAEGAGVRVRENEFQNNVGGRAEASGDVAALAPEGVAVAVMGYAQTLISDNAFEGSGLAHVMALAYPLSGGGADYVAIPRDLMIAQNRFEALAAQAPAGGPFGALKDLDAQADVLWDGAESWFAGGKPRVGVVRIGFGRNRVRGDGDRPPSFKSLGLAGAGTPPSEAQVSVERPLALEIPAPEIDAPR